MPQVQEVNVGVVVSADGIAVVVTPWACHVHRGDKVQWVRATKNISSLTIKKDTPTAAWPFDPSPPNAAYSGRNPKTPNGRKSNLRRGKRVAYTIVAEFKYGRKTRSVTIDPDMVID